MRGHLLLYSTNVYLKNLVQQQWRHRIHYVWCSETFDSTKSSAYSPGAAIPPTSSPIEIYRDLKKAVENGDAHNYKINEQKASLVRLAKLWEKRGEITKSDKEDIIWLATKSPNMLRWRPLIYLIPRSFSIDGRMRPVPAAKCAGLGREYIIQDLKESEFDIIEI